MAPTFSLIGGSDDTSHLVRRGLLARGWIDAGASTPGRREASLIWSCSDDIGSHSHQHPHPHPREGGNSRDWSGGSGGGGGGGEGGGGGAHSHVTNHFRRNGAITTKVGLASTLRQLPWVCSVDDASFFPRCYDIGNRGERTEFVADFRRTAAENLVKGLCSRLAPRLERGELGGRGGAGAGARGGALARGAAQTLGTSEAQGSQRGSLASSTENSEASSAVAPLEESGSSASEVASTEIAAEETAVATTDVSAALASTVAPPEASPEVSTHASPVIMKTLAESEPTSPPPTPPPYSQSSQSPQAQEARECPQQDVPMDTAPHRVNVGVACLAIAACHRYLLDEMGRVSTHNHPTAAHMWWDQVVADCDAAFPPVAGVATQSIGGRHALLSELQWQLLLEYSYWHATDPTDNRGGRGVQQSAVGAVGAVSASRGEEAFPERDEECAPLFDAHGDGARLAAMAEWLAAVSIPSDALESQIRHLTRVMECGNRGYTQSFMGGETYVWVVKPAAACRGVGVTLHRNLSSILTCGIQMQSRMVQKYVERPLLLRGGFKFDLRQWVLVTSWTPLTVWLYNAPYLRLCGAPFDLGKVGRRRRPITQLESSGNRAQLVSATFHIVVHTPCPPPQPITYPS